MKKAEKTKATGCRFYINRRSEATSPRSQAPPGNACFGGSASLPPVSTACLGKSLLYLQPARFSSIFHRGMIANMKHGPHLSFTCYKRGGASGKRVSRRSPETRGVASLNLFFMEATRCRFYFKRRSGAPSPPSQAPPGNDCLSGSASLRAHASASPAEALPAFTAFHILVDFSPKPALKPENPAHTFHFLATSEAEPRGKAFRGGAPKREESLRSIYFL